MTVSITSKATDMVFAMTAPPANETMLAIVEGD
ncbi:MAG: hypothetical protein ACJAWG_003687, partial [Candidatus Azotimanducaceae bacterium]